ncbi:MAG: HipA domain-containing protein [Oscillospiraceae bacterium]|nr:HipA domain-containing protein [Oscillospiraceae bacterium]
MAVIMCKDVPVYDIVNNKVLNKQLCPVRIRDEHDFSNWVKARQFIRTNVAAKDVLDKANSIDERLSKRRMSLSDCYWIKYRWDSSTEFKDITPYFNEFVNHRTEWGYGKTVPSRELGGSFLKTWERINGELYIEKSLKPQMARAEMLALALAHRLGIKTCKGWAVLKNKEWLSSDKFNNDILLEDMDSTIYIENLTDTDNMLIPLSWNVKTKMEGSNGHNIAAMAYAYRRFVQDKQAVLNYITATILFDFVVGNDDRRRNMSNWAYYKNSNNGKCSLAPLYDFNLAHYSKFYMSIETFRQSVTSNKLYKKIATGLLKDWGVAIGQFGVDEWVLNYERLRKELE